VLGFILTVENASKSQKQEILSFASAIVKGKKKRIAIGNSKNQHF
jgi:hypothetical protein